MLEGHLGVSQSGIQEPDETRQMELRTVYLEGSETPYKGVRIRTLGELYWIMKERKWSGETFLSEGMSRANLRGADFDWANLSDVHLVGANLSDAYLSKVNLSGAYLVEANLSGAYLVEANLSRAILEKGNLNEADLGYADLRSANLGTTSLKNAVFTGADLSHANLVEANLSGADLSEANLSSGDMRAVKMDAETNLDRIILDRFTKLGDIRWNGAPLLRVHWTPTFVKGHLHLGDEEELKQQTRQERITALSDVARAYRGIGRQFKEQNMPRRASSCRLKVQRFERSIRWQERKFYIWFPSWLLDIVSGYGELPVRTFLSYILVMLFFAGLDFIVTNTVDVGKSVAHLSWDQSLVLSLTSFHGRGFFPGYIQLDDWIARIGAVEAVIGLFIELILIATFSRRFLGD